MEEMETRMNRVAFREGEDLLSDKITCSICGKVLDSSFKGIFMIILQNYWIKSIKASLSLSRRHVIYPDRRMPRL